ncbi:dipeptide/oligopeptide/nickel ABC transporter ATP-binding protein [Candidatus Marsarchaeota G2 archaeon BE_D]|uniref:Dipeptide/oligopeptide/nickel ABC transporter ATP-binding protein n=1 Tax=Candidatus Marsarchaeota G2 archaeon BE_D TaxID=1978158 RepID=A0A2R6CB32_9ARCH|nr:MAG: dipeptide/oligopeptide/nickel ABC transporter ATP-binding protein [Candidatus Marsarchaeota G2 archaeon BE_D]
MFLSLLDIENLKVYFATRAGTVRAVDGVELSVGTGEVLGLAGESGSGKTTLGYALMRVLPRNAKLDGKIIFDGRDLLTLSANEFNRVRGREIAMVFQGSMNSLNPVVRVEEQVAEPLILHSGMNGDEAKKRARELLAEVGVSADKAKSYPHELSGGLKQRVAIAMAISTRPKLLIADEPTTALDVVTQAQILRLISELRDRFGLSVIMISHDLSLLSEVCDRLAIMYAGKIVEVGSKAEIVKTPEHPYTQALLASIPSVERVGEDSPSIPGEPPDPINPPSGCRFMPRCAYARRECEEFDGYLYELSSTHRAACVLVGGKPIERIPR